MKRIERILADCAVFEFGCRPKNKKSAKIRSIRFIRSPILRSWTRYLSYLLLLFPDVLQISSNRAHSLGVCVRSVTSFTQKVWLFFPVRSRRA